MSRLPNCVIGLTCILDDKSLSLTLDGIKKNIIDCNRNLKKVSVASHFFLDSVKVLTLRIISVTDHSEKLFDNERIRECNDKTRNKYELLSGNYPVLIHNVSRNNSNTTTQHHGNRILG